MRLKYSRQAGDTIIEVMVAFAVFSLVAVGAIVVMNQGIASAQRSLEITQVRQAIDSQATMLRYIHQAHVADVSQGTTNDTEWPKIIATSVSQASNFGVTSSNTCPDIPAGSFVIDPRTSTLSNSLKRNDDTSGTIPPYAQLLYPPDAPSFVARGIWIEAVSRGAQKDASGKIQYIGYVDFHIRACWDSVGSQVPVTLGTIVRLYEPSL